MLQQTMIAQHEPADAATLNDNDPAHQHQQDKKQEVEETDSCLETYTPWGSMKEHGFTSLHMALQTIAPFDSIRHLVHILPLTVGTQQETLDGRTPLHVGVQHYGYHTMVIQTLVTAYPEAVKIADCSGKLTLHYCMEKTPETVSEGTLLAVLEAYPPAASIMDDMGRTPLHFGLIHGAKDEFIIRVLQRHPASVFQTYKEWTPLHWAMASSVSALVVRAILEASSTFSPSSSSSSPKSSSAVLVQDGDGKNPLHVALGMGVTGEVIRILLDACPQAAQIRDQDGWYPLHHGIRYRAPLEARRLVEEAFPDAAEPAKNGNGTFRKPYELDTTEWGSTGRRRGYRVKS